MIVNLRDTCATPTANGKAPTVVRLIYSDETGVGSEADDPLTVVAAVLIHADEQWGPIETAIRALETDLVPPRRHGRYEFKASRLFRRRRVGDNGEILRRFLAIIREHELPVSYGAVPRASIGPSVRSLFTRLSDDAAAAATAAQELPRNVLLGLAQNLAFVMCATVVDEVFSANFPNERGLWIADENRVTTAMKASMREYQNFVASGLDFPLKTFAHIVDTVYFGKSHESRGLQLADACNFVIKQHLLGDAEIGAFYSIIEPCTNGMAAPTR